MSMTFSPCPNCGAINRISGRAASQGSPVCANCQAPLSLRGAVSEVDGRGLQRLIDASIQPVVVDFWADWCEPCKMFHPIFSQAAEKLLGKVVFAKIDTVANAPATEAHSVRTIPTLVLFNNGKEVKRVSGAMLLDQLLDWVREPAS